MRKSFLFSRKRIFYRPFACLTFLLSTLCAPSLVHSVEGEWLDVTSLLQIQAGDSSLPGERVYAKRNKLSRLREFGGNQQIYSAAGSLSYPDRISGTIRSTDYEFVCPTGEYTKKDGREEWSGVGYYIVPGLSRVNLDRFAYYYFCDLDNAFTPWVELGKTVRERPLYLNTASVRTVENSIYGSISFAVFASAESEELKPSGRANYETYIFAVSCSKKLVSSDVPDGVFSPSKLKMVKPYPESFGEYVLNSICEI